MIDLVIAAFKKIHVRILTINGKYFPVDGSARNTSANLVCLLVDIGHGVMAVTSP